MVQPNKTSSAEFSTAVLGILDSPVRITVHRNTIETVVSRIEWEISLEEKHPFLRILFDTLQSELNGKGISIEKIEHNQWQERYYLVRAGEKAAVNIEYDIKGFFGRVLPISKYCNSDEMLNDLRDIIYKLKPVEDVV